MKTNKIQITLMLITVALVLINCTIQKRTHRNGYYIDWKKQSKNNVQISESKNQKEENGAAKNLVASSNNLIELENANNLIVRAEKATNICGDTLYLATGEKIICQVVEIGSESIKYKLCDNIDGPIYSTSNSGVSKIVYINGISELINSNNVITQKSNQTNACNDTLCFNDGKIVYCEIIEVQKGYVKYRKCDSLNKAEYYAEKSKLKNFNKPISKPIAKPKSADSNSSINTKNDASTNPIKKYHPLAIASFLFGLFAPVAIGFSIINWTILLMIIGLLMFGIAIVFGIIAISAINKEKNKFKGLVFAFLGILSPLLAILIVVIGLSLIF